MLVNLTPHLITLVVGGEKIEIEPSGVVLRCAERHWQFDTRALNDRVRIPVIQVEYGDLAPPLPELPGWHEGANYIVSAIAARAIAQVASAWAGRFFVPARPVRDEQGRIIGAEALAIVQ